MSPYEGASDGKHYWLTPPDLMAQLSEEFGFDFDPCPYPRPDDFDGLAVEWGQSNYVNPPFKGPTAWVRKAIEEHKKGKTVVLVFPIDKWVHMLIEAGAEVRNLRDVRWCATEDGLPGKGTGRWIGAFVLRAPSAPAGEDVGTCPDETGTSPDTISDGYMLTSVVCPECGKPTMQVVRPGKVQCSECG